MTVEQMFVPGPPTSLDLRAPWAEPAILSASLGGGHPDKIVAPNGAVAEAAVVDGRIRVAVSCGDPLDEVVLRSYVVGAAHQALGWVTSEGIAVDDEGRPLDLTIRSFGILRASEMPPVDVEIDETPGEPTNGSDAAFAAVAAAVWRAQDHPADWPTGRLLRER
ncbi:MAG: molybdopterin cofactor-binding domain-containing protein [Acidimicrobiia bacterium]|nr:molybdopterin cofactor-binding domain-containing protein [Acidimicrobiia bacterium]